MIAGRRDRERRAQGDVARLEYAFKLIPPVEHRLFTPVVKFTSLTLVHHAGKNSLLDVVNPAQIASQPTARLRIGFLILRRTTK